MAQRYQNIMVAIDGSKEADLAFVKGVHSALRNDAKLTIAHVIDTRALQSVSTFDAEVYEELQVDAESLMKEYEKRAKMLVWQMFISSLNGKSKDPTGTYYSRC